MSERDRLDGTGVEVGDGEDFFEDGPLSRRSRVFQDEAYGKLMDFSDNTFEVSVSRVTLIERKSSEKKFILPRRGRSRGTLKNFSVQELAEELATGKRTKEKLRKMSVIEAGSSEKKNGGAEIPRKKVDFISQKSENSS
jgi:hypothetical protein